MQKRLTTRTIIISLWMTVTMIALAPPAQSSPASNNNRGLPVPQLQPIPQTLTAADNQATSFDNPQASRFINTFKTTLNALEQHKTGTFAQSNVTRPRRASSFADHDDVRPKLRLRNNGTPLQVRALLPVVSGHFSDASSLNIARARAFLNTYRGLIGIDRPDEELHLDSDRSINNSEEAHLRFSQYYKGIPVWPAELIVHFRKNDTFGLLNGAYIHTPKKSLLTKPVVTKNQAETAALATFHPRTEHISPSVTSDLIIYSSDDQTPALAWKCIVEQNAMEKWLVVVDALTGEILSHYSLIEHGAVSGSGIDLSQQVHPLNIWQQGAKYALIDTSKQMFQPGSVTPGRFPDPNTTIGAIFTLDLHNQNPEQNSTIQYILSSNANADWLADGVSAAHNLALVYDYYQNHHHRNAIDGRGGSMISIVRVGSNYDNAFWSGQAMFFGDAEPFAGALDVVGHELTHGVTQYTANLVYKNQSGALNEAMSDIFGEMVEAANTGGQPDWLMGSLPLQQPFRDMKDPHNPNTIGAPYPAHMNEYVQTDQDNGGVHINSSIINHAYYLIAAGLQDAIGITDAEQIFYRALTMHLVANSQFIDCRMAAINAASELFGQDSAQVKAIGEGFDAVGITVGPTTPPPGGHPSTPGSDATLFTCFDPQYADYYLCRQSPSDNDPANGVFLSTRPINGSKPASVTDDGSIALFINAENDLCLQPVNGSIVEQCLGYSGLIHNIAISGNGKKYAFTFLGGNGDPENSITVYDQDTDQTRTIELRAPTQDAVATDTILYADALTFTRDGSMLFFDALNVLSLDNNEKIKAWSIYGLDIASSSTFFLVRPLRDIDTSYPSLSRTSDNLIVFTASQPGSGTSTIYAGNLNNTKLSVVAQTGGEYAVAGYNGDADKVIYDSLDNSTATGYSLLAQSVTNDHITPTGNQEIWIRDGAVPAIFRPGAHFESSAATGYYDPATGYLHLDSVQVQGSGFYTVDLLLTGLEPLRFRLTTATPIADNPDGNVSGLYEPGSGLLSIPTVTVTDSNSNTSIYRVVMQLISENYDFQVTTLTQLQ